MKKLLVFFVAYLFTFSAYAQNDTCGLRLTLLTCGPGEDLYSVFGHSALRVTDRARNVDIIYNYGTFDFADPDFYVKFVRGKLLYYVSEEQFRDFYASYKAENRYIIEQELDLACDEKTRLAEALRTNALEQNKYYLYEFLFDNCSTRLRDIVVSNKNDSVRFRRIISTPAPTFRNMLHEYLDRGEQHWSKFGIDLLLGSRIDRKVLNEEAMFLPDYLMQGFDSSVVQTKSLVLSKNTILPAADDGEAGFSVTPMVVAIMLLLLGIAVTFIKNTALQKVGLTLDVALYFILGVMGCLMLFMWYGTEHELCRNNYNLYWALPTHLVAAFFVRSKAQIARKYFTITAILNAVFLLCWFFLPQGMNNAFFPLILLSAIRSFYHASKKY